MTEKEYRSYPALSRSELWKIRESPEKFQYARTHPIKATEALLFGQVVHKFILETDSFLDDFAVLPEGIDRRTKAGKAMAAEFEASIGDRTVIPGRMMTTAAEMAEKLRSVPSAFNLMYNSNGQNEVPYFWTDDLTGEPCKCRVDRIISRDGEPPLIIDYKTAANASLDGFNSAIYKHGYHFQAAMYSAGVKAAMGLDELPEFVFVVQEKNPPYSVNVVEINDSVMSYGFDTFRELIGIYHECNELGYWPGYTGFYDEPCEAYLPGYVTLGTEEPDDIEES